MPDFAKRIPRLQKGRGVDGCAGVERQRITQFHGVFLKSRRTQQLIALRIAGGQRIVLVASQTDQFPVIQSKAHNPIATHIKTPKGHLSRFLGVIAQPSVLNPTHQHQITHQLGVLLKVKTPFVVFHPLVALLGGGIGTELASQQRIGRSNLCNQGEIGPAARKDGLVNAVTR